MTITKHLDKHLSLTDPVPVTVSKDNSIQGARFTVTYRLTRAELHAIAKWHGDVNGYGATYVQVLTFLEETVQQNLASITDPPKPRIKVRRTP